MTNPTPRAPKAHRAASVYRLYDAEGTLLYIGSAYDPEHRCKSHSKQAWWPQVARRTEEPCESRGAAYSAEMAAIVAERPRYNAMGPGYAQPVTPAVRQRNELASRRQKLVREAGQVRLNVSRALCNQGVRYEDAARAGEEAEIDFLEKTGLFAGAVKRRRALVSDPASEIARGHVARAFQGAAPVILGIVWEWIDRAGEPVPQVEELRQALLSAGYGPPARAPQSASE